MKPNKSCINKHAAKTMVLHPSFQGGVLLCKKIIKIPSKEHKV